MANDSLTKFANVLYTEALEEKKKIADRLSRERKDALAEKDYELNARYKREVEKYRLDIEYEVRLALSRREAELSQTLRRNRAKAADEVFAEAEAQLVEFVGSDKYEEYLRREFADVAGEFASGTTVCAARGCDAEIIRKISPVAGLEITETSDDIIGGFTLKNSELGIFADCTLKAKLEEQKERFFGSADLVID